jgi:transcriptional regulator with XRE-family HTH domain
MNVGMCLKEARIRKGLTQKQVAAGVMSRSHLSELEHNRYYCAYDKLLLLLKNINLSLTEFEELLNESVYLEEELLFEKFALTINRNNLKEIENVKKELADYLNTHSSLRMEHAILLCDAIPEYLLKKEMTLERYQPIIHYLMNCKLFSWYEINLFNASMFLFPLSCCKKIVNEKILARGEHLSIKSSYTLLAMLLNLSDLLIREKDYTSVKKYCVIGIRLAKKFNHIYPQILLQLNYFIAEYKESGQLDKTFYRYINSLKLLGYPEMAEAVLQEILS